MKKVVLYGAGRNCEKLLHHVDFSKVQIIGVVDKNKSGLYIEGQLISGVSQLRIWQFDEILVTLRDYVDVVEMLITEYDIERDKILIPCEINKRYLLSRINDYKNIFISTTPDYGCEPYLFINLEKNNKMLILSLLDCNDNCVFDLKDTKERLFIIPSVSILPLEKMGIISNIKSFFPNSRSLLWIVNPISDDDDIVSVMLKDSKQSQILRNNFDELYTYHSLDAKTYDLSYYPQFFPDVSNRFEHPSKEYDVFFIGKAKERLSLIHDIYSKLESGGLECRFYLFDVDKEKQLNKEGLIYMNEYLSYEDVLRKMQGCRCVLEVCNGDDETSLRYAEAVIFKKKLLVNDDSVKNKPYYNEKNMLCFQSVDDIDINWFRTPMSKYEYLGELEPEYYLGEVAKLLC